ncbi:unnamed protein product [Chondrus crispus]|uniref:Uncharacterized protein n=1 Tax=Chondrus crispus TaxID=2769 RepID=R7QPS3_CHOCR|nr:unnamed protein product [Chondrus crispus]CDF40104.1 unnamed protein product [Chondrus crispus]|eukprot:XP_005710398.1 unnamed protein product [Chondrus crispus]
MRVDVRVQPGAAAVAGVVVRDDGDVQREQLVDHGAAQLHAVVVRVRRQPLERRVAQDPVHGEDHGLGGRQPARGLPLIRRHRVAVTHRQRALPVTATRVLRGRYRLLQRLLAREFGWHSGGGGGGGEGRGVEEVQSCGVELRAPNTLRKG